MVIAVLAVAAQNKRQVYLMDVKSNFLNGILEEEVYVNQTPRFEIQSQEHKVYKLKKGLIWFKVSAKSME